MTMQTITLEREKETANTFRYKEMPEDGKPPVLDTLYLKKWLKPGKKIRVTIETIEE